MQPRVILTGGSGFIGRHTVGPLRQAGFEVHALGRRFVPEATCHAVDLLNNHETAAAVDSIGATHLLHLAWDVTHGAFWNAPSNLDWTATSLNLYRAFVRAGGRRAVMAGSCAEYDWSCSTLDEDRTPLRPATLYGASKHALQELLAMAATRDQCELAWGRVFFLYGPHEGQARLVPSVIVPLLHGLPVRVGKGLARRDFMHVQDAADAFVTTLASKLTGPVNIATGLAVPMRDIVTAIAAQIGQPNLVQFGARSAPANEPAILATSAQRLHGIGFRPRFTVQTGLEDTIAWWRRVGLGIE
ncbi:MAG: hypothetical protein B7X48_12920 [Acidiphilium sp. 34-60-192]|nr:MAG: hypothetical protein B7X48_12920 [Acidiphilium sp. 34-60-192]